MNNGSNVKADHLAIIRKLPLFAGVDSRSLNTMLEAARVIDAAKGDVILNQGEPLLRFYIVLEGWVGVYKNTADGNESILQIFGREDFLPEASAMGGGQCPWNARAISSVQLLSLPSNAVMEQISASPSLVTNLLFATAKRAQDLLDRVEQLTLRTAEERVGRFLLQLRLELNPKGRDIPLPFDKALIATYLGIKPETLSRVLQNFRERGFTTDRHVIGMPDEHALCGFCDSTTARLCQHATPHECPNPDVLEDIAG